ncbi:MAG TPA: hypothetical protein VFV31_07470 [Chitinophagaceae bacterium]|nr:hypothetical protein [Chitinophagaceae bacterium]
MSTNPFNELIQLATSLQQKGLSTDEITLQLRQKGTPENLLEEIIAELKKIRLTQKRNSGFIWCAIGATLMALGFVFTLFLFNNTGGMRFAMYGLTTIGVGFTIKGLSDIMGW